MLRGYRTAQHRTNTPSRGLLLGVGHIKLLSSSPFLRAPLRRSVSTKPYWERALSVMAQIEKFKYHPERKRRYRRPTQTEYYWTALLAVHNIKAHTIRNRLRVPESLAKEAERVAAIENEKALRQV